MSADALTPTERGVCLCQRCGKPHDFYPYKAGGKGWQSLDDGHFYYQETATEAATRAARLDDALRDVLDVVAGWSRPMPLDDQITAIREIATAALAIAEAS